MIISSSRAKRGIIGGAATNAYDAAVAPKIPRCARDRHAYQIFLSAGDAKCCDHDRRQAVTWPTPLEIAAALLILANVWLATKENIWTWPTGIAGVILYTIVNYKAGLFANAGLQIVYLVLSIIGWHEWLHGGPNHGELHVRRTTLRQWIGCGIASAVLCFAIYKLLLWTHTAQQLFFDSGTTALSLVGQWMMNEKLLENWWFWLIVDIAYVPIYYRAGNWVTSILYAIFCILCIKGIVDWKRSLSVSYASA